MKSSFSLALENKIKKRPKPGSEARTFTQAGRLRTAERPAVASHARADAANIHSPSHIHSRILQVRDYARPRKE